MTKPLKMLSAASLFISVCFALASPNSKPETAVQEPSPNLIETKKIDKFYSDLAKLDKWYSTTQRMPKDAAIYKEKLDKLIKDTKR